MKKNTMILLVFSLSLFAWFSHGSYAQYAVQAGEFTVEPPTLLCAGFEWNIQGDDNRNSVVEVNYRKKGANEWKQALPLMRLNGEHSVEGYVLQVSHFTAPNMFAGSIFNLEPGATYECRFVMKDPDGVRGEAERTAEVTTRTEPKAYEGGRVFHVYPPDFKGPKQEPSCVSIMEAYYGSGKSLWGSATIQPGDVILVHAGLYKSNRRTYYEPLGMHFHGCYALTKNGTFEKPIVIRGAGDGEAILDGNGVYRLFDVIYADYTYIEGLTIRNCEVAIMAGLRFSHGCNGLVVRNCRIEDVGCAVNAQYGGSKNFYIADNVMIGREDSIRTLNSFIAVDVNGKGHVVCHNYVANFFDGIDVTEQGPPESEDWKVVSIDFYNNDIRNALDNFLEPDSGVHNIRVFKNRGFDCKSVGLSAQPIYGGPAYIFRNIVYHAGAFKFNNSPIGVYVFHNTICSEWVNTVEPFSNVHLRNNLFLGHDIPNRPVLRVSTWTSYTTFDYDGYRANRNSEIQFVWKSPDPGKVVIYDLKELEGNTISGSFKTLEEFYKKTGREEHGILVDYDIFQNVTMADPANKNRLYDPKDFDFRLKPDSKAVDAGCILPNINDGFTGKAPDLGATEVGAPEEVYGPRTGNRP